MKAVFNREGQSAKYLVPTLILTYIFTLSGVVWAKPRESEIEKALSEALSKEWSIVYYKVDVSENYGTKVEPYWKYRFRGKVKLQTDTYMQDHFKNNVVFLKKSGQKGKKVEIFGIASAEMYQGKWKIKFSLDKNPFYKYGKPRSSYKGRTIIVGSPEEQEFLDEVSKKELQRKMELAEKQRQAKIAREKLMQKNKLAQDKKEHAAKLARQQKDRNKRCIRAIKRAGISGNTDSVKVVIEKGLDVDGRNDALKQAVLVAISKKRAGKIQKDAELSKVARKRFFEIIKILLEKGVDDSAITTASQIAGSAKDFEVLIILQEH